MSSNDEAQHRYRQKIIRMYGLEIEMKIEKIKILRSILIYDGIVSAFCLYNGEVSYVEVVHVTQNNLRRIYGIYKLTQDEQKEVLRHYRDVRYKFDFSAEKEMIGWCDEHCWRCNSDCKKCSMGCISNDCSNCLSCHPPTFIDYTIFPIIRMFLS